MDQFFTHLPEWVISLGFVITGGFAIIGITDYKAKELLKGRKDEQEKLQESIRALYKEESEAQNEKIRDQSGKLKELSERLATVEGENKTFRSLLTGTDEKSIEYRQRVEATLKLVDQLAKVIALNGTKTEAILELSEKTNKNIEKLIKVMSKKK